MKIKVPFWRTSFGEDEIKHIARSIRSENISQGLVTKEFENQISKILEIDHVIAVTSGTAALTLAYLSQGVGPGDEVIVPNRTWIATGHAASILGAKVILADVLPHSPIIDPNKIESLITKRTKIIVAVHMNGRGADMKKLKNISEKFSISIVEDAAQALFSKNKHGFLGTQSEVGCFSLSVGKIISTGQGGLVVTHNKDLAEKMRKIRTHGLEHVKDPNSWNMPGYNFRYTDIQASIGLEQIRLLPKRAKYLCEIYDFYKNEIKNKVFKLIPVKINEGEIPVYNEYLIENRGQWIKKLEHLGIETRRFYPDLSEAHYYKKHQPHIVNPTIFGSNGIYLPSGPTQPIQNIKFVSECCNS